jgi:hypothetical protein
MFKRLYNGTSSLTWDKLSPYHYKPSQYRSKYIELAPSDCEILDDDPKSFTINLPAILTGNRVTSTNDRSFLLVFNPSLKVGVHVAECMQGTNIFQDIKPIKIPVGVGLPSYVVRVYELDSNFNSKE